jgi:ABC-type multidrug transport system fused ATPase/permease subunit
MTVIAEESYQNIRTVKAFANEEEESRKFLVGNQKVFQSGKKKALITGL